MNIGRWQNILHYYCLFLNNIIVLHSVAHVISNEGGKKLFLNPSTYLIVEISKLCWIQFWMKFDDPLTPWVCATDYTYFYFSIHNFFLFLCVYYLFLLFDFFLRNFRQVDSKLVSDITSGIIVGHNDVPIFAVSAFRHTDPHFCRRFPK